MKLSKKIKDKIIEVQVDTAEAYERQKELYNMFEDAGIDVDTLTACSNVDYVQSSVEALAMLTNNEYTSKSIKECLEEIENFIQEI